MRVAGPIKSDNVGEEVQVSNLSTATLNMCNRPVFCVRRDRSTVERVESLDVTRLGH